jgi:hypothetical protein
MTRVNQGGLKTRSLRSRIASRQRHLGFRRSQWMTTGIPNVCGCQAAVRSPLGIYNHAYQTLGKTSKPSMTEVSERLGPLRLAGLLTMCKHTQAISRSSVHPPFNTSAETPRSQPHSSGLPPPPPEDNKDPQDNHQESHKQAPVRTLPVRDSSHPLPRLSPLLTIPDSSRLPARTSSPIPMVSCLSTIFLVLTKAPPSRRHIAIHSHSSKHRPFPKDR